MFWSKKKEIASTEYADLLVRYGQVAQDVALIKAQMQHLEDLVRSVRGLVNRKLNKDDIEDNSQSIDTQAVQRALLGFPQN